MKQNNFSKSLQGYSIENIELIGFAEVRAIVPLSKSRLYALMREGKFPRPIKLGDGGHRSCWIKHEILAYLAERIAARDS